MTTQTFMPGALLGDAAAQVPYRAGKDIEEEMRRNHWLSFALTLNTRCLPTVIRMTPDKQEQFLEYREGADAWKH